RTRWVRCGCDRRGHSRPTSHPPSGGVALFNEVGDLLRQLSSVTHEDWGVVVHDRGTTIPTALTRSRRRRLRHRGTGSHRYGTSSSESGESSPSRALRHL